MRHGVSPNSSVVTYLDLGGQAVPEPRSRAAAVSSGQRVYLYGGCSSMDPVSGCRLRNDLHSFDLNSGTWRKEIVLCVDCEAAPRIIHGVFIQVADTTCILQGGLDDQGDISAAMYCLDLQAMTWSDVAPHWSGLQPLKRMQHAAALDPSTFTVYFHGGVSPVPGGHYSVSDAVVYTFSLRTQKWGCLPEASLCNRAALRDHMMAVVPGKNTLLLLGGYTDITLGCPNTLLYHIDTPTGLWTPIELRLPPVGPDVTTLLCRHFDDGILHLWEHYADGSHAVADITHLSIGAADVRRIITFGPRTKGPSQCPAPRDHATVVPTFTQTGGLWYFGGEEPREILRERVRVADDPAEYADWDRLLTEWGPECRALYNDCHLMQDNKWIIQPGLTNSSTPVKLPQVRPLGTTPLPCPQEVHRKRTEAKVNTTNVTKRIPMWQRDTRCVDISTAPPEPDYNLYYGLKAMPTVCHQKKSGIRNKPLHKLAEEKYVLQRRREVLQKTVPKRDLERFETMLDECIDKATKDHTTSAESRVNSSNTHHTRHDRVGADTSNNSNNSIQRMGTAGNE